VKAADLSVTRRDVRKNGTYYYLDAVGAASGIGTVSVKHTLSGTFVCLTCALAYYDPRPSPPVDRSCLHVRAVRAHAEAHPESEDAE
jgi:hypothetical protein